MRYKKAYWRCTFARKSALAPIQALLPLEGRKVARRARGLVSIAFIRK